MQRILKYADECYLAVPTSRPSISTNETELGTLVLVLTVAISVSTPVGLKSAEILFMRPLIYCSHIGQAPRYLRDLVRLPSSATSLRPVRSLDLHDLFVPLSLLGLLRFNIK